MCKCLREGIMDLKIFLHICKKYTYIQLYYLFFKKYFNKIKRGVQKCKIHTVCWLLLGCDIYTCLSRVECRWDRHRI